MTLLTYNSLTVKLSKLPRQIHGVGPLFDDEDDYHCIQTVFKTSEKNYTNRVTRGFSLVVLVLFSNFVHIHSEFKLTKELELPKTC